MNDTEQIEELRKWARPGATNEPVRSPCPGCGVEALQSGMYHDGHEWCRDCYDEEVRGVDSARRVIEQALDGWERAIKETERVKRSITSLNHPLQVEIQKLRVENERLRMALEFIETYPVGSRRDSKGYPFEVAYDEYAYKRIVDFYREYAQAALAMKEAKG